MPMEQLKMLFLNPQPGSPPLWAVISALAEKQKEAQAIQAAMGQGAMAQNAQMQQQPPVAAQVMQAAESGIMQGYAGGGAVAFGRGGNVQHFRDGSNENGIQSFMERFPKDSGARMLYEWIKAGRPALKKPILDALVEKEQQVVESTTDTGDEMSRMLGRAPAPVPMSMRDTRGATPETVAATRNLGIGQPQQRQEAARPAPAPAEPGIAGLMGPMIEPERLAMRGAVDERQAAIRNAAKTPEDVLKARGGIDALMKEIVDARRAEEQRLMTHSDKRLEEARARAAQSPLSDITFLGQMLEGMSGAKRFGDALAGAASGAGKAQTARSQALQAAEEKYDLSRRDIFNLANLRQQVQLDQAKLAEARASGEADKANKAALDLAQSKEALAKFEAEVSNKSREFGLEERKLTQQGQISREQMQSQERVAAANRAASAALRNLPSVEQQMAERVMNDYMEKNPGSTLSDAWDFYRGSRASSAADRNLLARQKLLAENPLYKIARMQEIQEKDPAKKAEAQRQVQELERKAGIVDGAASPAPSQAAPPVGTVMQGYRFKGGNPADRNNWEKV
jgi:hypothetical protein